MTVLYIDKTKDLSWKLEGHLYGIQLPIIAILLQYKYKYNYSVIYFLHLYTIQ
jgi:hypothetical protein